MTLPEIHSAYFFTDTQFLSKSWYCCLCNDKHSNSLLARVTCCYYTFRYNPSGYININGRELKIPPELQKGGTVVHFSCLEEGLKKFFPICPVCNKTDHGGVIHNADVTINDASYLPKIH